jgi:hypothetical protein
LLFLAGVFFLSWWESSAGRIDLRTIELCHSTGCVKEPLSQAGGSRLWGLTGVAAFSTAIVSAVLLFAGGVRALIAPRPGSKLSWVGAALAIFSGLMGLGFVLSRPDFQGLSPGYGIASYLAGAGLGALGGMVLSRKG